MRTTTGLKRYPAARVFQPRLRFDKGQPVGRVRWQQAHAVAFVQRQTHVRQIAENGDDFLAGSLACTFYNLERGLRGEDRFDRTHQHHADHHDREDGDRVAGHVHDQQVHGHLLDGAERQVPGALQQQVRGVRFGGHLDVPIADGWIVAGRRGRRHIGAALVPVSEAKFRPVRVSCIP